MKETTVQELKKMMDDKADFQLIDVREEYEFETGNIGGELMPLSTIFDRHNDISKEKPVIIHCRSGARSAAAINELEKRYGFKNLSNLKGGVIAWSKEIDSSFQVA